MLFVKTNLKTNIWKIKNIVKLGIDAIIQGNIEGAAHSICNLKYSEPKKIPLVFHNGSNYDLSFYHKRVSTRI